MAPKFRSNVWDPILIVSQIICMQCLFYVSSGLLLVLCALLFLDAGPHLGWLFDDREVRLGKPSGQCVFVIFLLAPVFCSMGLWRLVRRTKQCLDFACTLHFWHLIFCTIYTQHFPQTVLWWMTNLISVIVTTVMGEYLCMRTELKSIPLGGSPGAAGNC
ncbi:hypothetical protein P879_03691 [Paragonimus westermani]|uniref:Protein SYS1 homolog n=1 Tax=Paragonimus westermani TaxID=34504 RepID=A0A8T0DR19_9TREM|nr:hypothetical protein P879_03691 [Paragonimus westermani]